MRGRIYVVQGGQFGSEGKGGVIHRIASMGYMGHCVRTGSINAGHTFYRNGQPIKMQQIPAAWDAPGVQLYIGPGAYIHPDILREELKLDPSIIQRLWIDNRAGVHLPADEADAKAAGRHYLIGATGKGCAEAIIHKIQARGQEDGLLFRDVVERLKPEWTRDLLMIDVPERLNRVIDMGQDVWLEGTQGTGLDLHLGPYPYTTSRMTSSANWLAESGLSPAHDVGVILVLRTYPIRVAGNSGPMKYEINWWDLWERWWGYRAAPQVPMDTRARVEAAYYKAFAHIEGEKGHNIALSEALSDVMGKGVGLSEADHANITGAFEMTTVTLKPRRIAELDLDQVRMAAVLERPHRLVVTFLNYRFPELWGETQKDRINQHVGARRYLDMLQEITGAPVWMVTTGPQLQHHVVVGQGL